MYVGSSLPTHCRLDHVPIAGKLWLEECALWVRLWWHEPIHMVRGYVCPALALLPILPILIEVERFAHGMRNVLSCLRHAIVRMTVRRHSQVWAIWCLNLKLLVDGRIILRVSHPSLPGTPGCCPDVPLLLELLRLVAIEMKVFSAFARGRWLKEKIILQLLSLVSHLLLTCCWTIFDRSVVNSGVLWKLVLTVVLDFLACVVTTLIS